MYSIKPYTGSELPSKCLCLTYDDGPGKDTHEIAEFLSQQNVPATFFVVGKYAVHHPDILEKVAALGHLIGNHTYEHPDMPYYLSVNGDVHNQILRTDSIIRNYISGNTVYFRSPYGKWSVEVANELNQNVLSNINHIGPIHWDIGGVDCFCWKNCETVDSTVQKYLDDINAKGRGIVVMHDEIADIDFLKAGNKTLELTKKLIPLLKKQGYYFVRLDEIESIKEDAVKPLTGKLKITNGKYLTLADTHDYTLILNGKKNDPDNEITLFELGNGQVALKAANGLYLSLRQNDGNAVRAAGTAITSCETFDLIPFSAGQIAFRAFDGNFLSKENKRDGRLFAGAAFMRGAKRFTFLPHGIETRETFSLRKKYQSFRRQASYIMSKVKRG